MYWDTVLGLNRFLVSTIKSWSLVFVLFFIICIISVIDERTVKVAERVKITEPIKYYLDTVSVTTSHYYSAFSDRRGLLIMTITVPEINIVVYMHWRHSIWQDKCTIFRVIFRNCSNFLYHNFHNRLWITSSGFWTMVNVTCEIRMQKKYTCIGVLNLLLTIVDVLCGTEELLWRRMRTVQCCSQSFCLITWEQLTAPGMIHITTLITSA